MKNHLTLTSRGRASRLTRRVALGAATLAAVMVPATAAHAEYYLSKTQAQHYAKDFASKHYGRSSGDLVTVCRTQFTGYNPNYVYHRWVCAWGDVTDGTTG